MIRILSEFRRFAARGNVVELAVGIIIGTAFTAIVNSLVRDIFTPLLGLMTGGLNFTNLFVVLKEGANAAGPYATLADAQAAGAVTINYGVFLNALISFLLVALVCFVLIRNLQRLRDFAARHESDEASEAADAVAQRECPFCIGAVSPRASRCPHCTSSLQGAMPDS